MPRTPVRKELRNTRLASGYGGWIYCDSCGKNIGYLCYVTYDRLCFEYQCACGGCGGMRIDFQDVPSVSTGNGELILKKHRLCCPVDESPLFTILDKNLLHYQYEVVCVRCGTTYRKEK